MQELNWIEKLNKENKVGEISISIENYRNIRKKLNFKFIKGGINIIVGKNNVGKTNILDYIYEKASEWNGLDNDAFKRNEKGNYLHKNLPLFFGNNKPVFFEKHEKISSLIREDSGSWFFQRPAPPISIEELNVRYLYKLYYLDLKTFFNFLDNEFENDETPKKIKIGGCNLKYIENFDEQTLKRVSNKKSLIWGEKIEEREESWKIKYSGNVAETIDKVRDKETNSINYRAFNESTNEFHSISNIGSGHLKFQKIKTLINSFSFETSPSEICSSILLIDELELLFHPPLIAAVSNLIKDLKENNVTVIFSTHYPSLLSQFACEDNVSFALVKNERDKRKKMLLGEVIYFWDAVEEMKTDIEKVWKSYCNCLKSQISKDDKFYYNHWKSLLNEHTLRIFFTEKVLFVEGMSDYVLFTNKLLQRHISELKGIEVIPIFSKSNYAFFKELGEKLHLDYWFLLDMDKHCVDEEKFPEKSNWEKEIDVLSTNENDLGKCSSKELNTNFWYRHRGELKKVSEIKEDKIAHSKFSRITWFPKNMEDFLFPEGKKGGFWGEHHWIRKEARIVGNISLEDFIPERFEELREELKEVIRWIKEKRKWEHLSSENQRKRLT